MRIQIPEQGANSNIDEQNYYLTADKVMGGENKGKKGHNAARH
jgi:hypothetical protein